MYDSRRLHGWNRFTGGSLVKFVSIMVRIQAKRTVDDFVLAPFNKVMLCMILAGCAGGTVLPAPLLSRLRPFWFASKQNGSVVILFCGLSTKFMLCMILAGCAGGTVLPAAL